VVGREDELEYRKNINESYDSKLKESTTIDTSQQVHDLLLGLVQNK
jgi:hypothetical protein